MANFKFPSFITILLVIFLSALTRSQLCELEKVEIICDAVKTEHWFGVGNLLTCKSEKSLTALTSDASVTSVVHKNKSQIANLAEIEGLYIYGAPAMKFIPAGIKQKSPKMKVLKIKESGLLSVTKENLKQFGAALEYLDLYDNKITSIDADLFEYNTNLKFINLQRNPLRFIAPEFFVNLKKMKNIEVVAFLFAGCINRYFQAGLGHRISTFSWNSEKCTDVTAKTETTFLIIEGKLKCLEDNVALLTANFERKLSLLAAKVDENDKKVDEKFLSVENSIKKLADTLEQKFTNLEEKIGQLRSDFSGSL